MGPRGALVVDLSAPPTRVGRFVGREELVVDSIHAEHVDEPDDDVAHPFRHDGAFIYDGNDGKAGRGGGQVSERVRVRGRVWRRLAT